MADVMWSTVTADSQPTDVTERVARLQLENATLRELLSAGRHSLASPVCNQGAQTDMALTDSDDVNASVSSCSKTSGGSMVDSIIIEASSRHEPAQTASSATHSSSPAVSSADVITQQETDCPLLN